MRICRSPELIAAYRVLRRLREPRHPSCALLRFRFFFALRLLALAGSPSSEASASLYDSIFSVICSHGHHVSGVLRFHYVNVLFPTRHQAG